MPTGPGSRLTADFSEGTLQMGCNRANFQVAVGRAGDPARCSVTGAVRPDPTLK
jgi:hypothetical protein